MNLQTVLYFTSILLTCALTGFLAWYAWRQPHVTGARSYAYMVLAESLLALTEIGVMLAGTQPQAAVWFSLRVPFAAIISVFWLFFAMEYSGRSDWLSKPVRAALFAIPLITQVVMVTSSLHGLWLVQDVGFEKIGPFWIADTSARITGLWYLVHTFYSTLLLVAGAGVLVVAAWRKPKILLVQALLVSLGALTALGMALVGVFNLLPELRFNPFVPGIGFSAVCYALAIFRFQFLKHTPTQESMSRLTSLEPQEKRSLAIFIFIFILIASGLAAASTLTYQNYEKHFRAQVDSQLGAIASLKADELQDWRDERLADASLFYHNENFSERVRGYLEAPGDAEARAKLLTWLEKIAASPEYDRIFLLDPQGVERISIPATADRDAVPAALVEHASASLASNEIIFLDFHRHSEETPIHLSLLVPIFDAQDNQRLGVLVLRIDPNTYLYPFIQRWPVPSESAETLLIRRDGEEAVYLNSLRFQTNTALNLHFPLTETQVPAVRAALGETGVVEGMDYRGVEVIADMRAVPNSPWFMVSKMDTTEVYAPLRERLWQTIFLFSTLILAAGAGLTLIWRQQRMLYYRAQAESTEALRISEEKFRLAFETSPDSVAITRAKDGMFVSVNKGFEQITGYTREDVIGKTSLEINIWKDPEDRRKIVEGLKAGGEVRNYEAPFLTRGGEIIGMMSAAIIRLDGEPHILNITRDITERKQAQEKLADSETRYRRLFEAARDGILILEAETGVVTDVNPFLIEMLGFPKEKILGKELWELGFFKDIAANKANFLELQKKEYIRYEDLPLETTDGRRFHVEFVSNVYQVDHHKVVQCNIRDITERRQADEKLKESNSDLKQSQAVAHVGNWKWNLKTSTVEWSDEMFHIFGIDKDSYSGRLGDVIAKVIHPDDLHIVLPSNAPEFAKNKPQEYRIIRPNDGEIRHIWAQTGEAILDEQGNPAFLTGIAQDITERKRAEDALRESEDKFKYIFDFSTVGKSITLPTGEIHVNRAFCDMLGYSAEELQNKKWQEISHPDDIGTTQKMVNSLLSGEKESARFIKRYLHKNGSVIWTDVSTSLRRGQDGQPLYFMTAVSDITERKQAEEALRESEDKFRKAFMTSPDSVNINRLEDGMYISINPGFTQIMGYAEADVMGKTSLELQIWENPAERDRLVQGLTKDGFVSNLEACFHRKDGGTRYGLMSASVIELSGVPHILSITRDITERKQAEEALRESEERFRQVYEHMEVGVAQVSLDFHIQSANEAYCRMLGYSEAELAGMHLRDITHPETLEENLRKQSQLVAGEIDHYRMEKRFIHKDGRVVYGLLDSGLIRDAHGNPLHFLSSVLDISERKQTEEKLTASEVRYRRLFEAARDGILILDAETGMVTDVNPFLVEMLSFPQEEIVGKELWELGFFKDIAANKANFLELQQKEYIRYEDLPLETADGHKFRVEFVSNVYQANHHKIVQCNIRDITERKRVEQQLAQYTEHLEEMVDERTRKLHTAHEQLVRQERLAMLGQVAGSIGHELRNPLGVISNAIYFLKIAQPDANDKIKEYLDIIENETRTSDKIITELLDFTRIKSLDRKAASVSELIRQTLERYPAPASVEVALEIPPGLPMVFTDPQHILQILGNLTVNACQAMNDSGQLTLSASVQDDMIAIAVQDTGIGISPANMSKLFEPLFTTKTKGIGLGLAVSKKLAEANGGRIEVQSEPGKGSTFTLFLPIYSS